MKKVIELNNGDKFEVTIDNDVTVMNFYNKAEHNTYQKSFFDADDMCEDNEELMDEVEEWLRKDEQ